MNMDRNTVSHSHASGTLDGQIEECPLARERSVLPMAEGKP